MDARRPDVFELLPPTQACRVDAVCRMFETKWRAGNEPRIEEYLAEADGPQRAALFRELLALELELRRARGERPDAREYRTRFPDRAAAIAAAFTPESAAPAGTDTSPGDLPAAQPATESLGSRIGPYLLLQPIGQGGMGVVYLAAQETPVRRHVALKIIKPGLDYEPVITRFKAERQALALMDHPHIAKVFDAGTTDAGRPYFVMELVHGIPITDYCDVHELTPTDRLGLFIAVCQAIQHAHQKGIIHRDVKPSNVLVTLHDERPVPKVIDFGLAKAIDQKLTERTIFTRFGQMLGTLEYMSPEQAGTADLDIDTRTDIYSLGVLLYELLTGSTPLARARLRAAGYSEILELIKDEEPPNPSARLAASCEALPSIAASRGIEPLRLIRLVQGELDWIVMKAIAKDRARRYETAGAFARDIERFLSHEPVEAGPPSPAYRLRKFARKHRAAILTSGTFGGLLLLAAVMSTFFAIRASRAETIARQALVRAQHEQAKTQTALNRLRAEQAKTQQAMVLATKEEQRAKQRAAEAKTVLDFFRDKLLAAPRPEGKEGGLGRDVTLRAALESAAAGIAAGFANQPVVEAAIRDTLGDSYFYLGESPLAIAQYERARALRATAQGLNHPDTLDTMTSLGNAYAEAGRTTDAIRLLEQTLKLSQGRCEFAPLVTLVAMDALANAYRDADRLADAIPLFEETLRLQKSARGSDDPSTLITMSNLAGTYHDHGRVKDAIALFEGTVRRSQSRLGAEHPDTLVIMSNLAAAYRDNDQLCDALSLYEKVLKLEKVNLGPDHPSTLAGMYGLATAYRRAGRTTDAIVVLEHLNRLAPAKLGPEHRLALSSMNSLVAAYLEAKQWAKAESQARECLRLRETKRSDDWWRYHTMSQLGAALTGQGKYQEAEALALSGYDGLKARYAAIPALGKPRLREAAERVVWLYEAWQKPEQAAAWKMKLGLAAPLAHPVSSRTTANRQPEK
jgi:serine/threonine protein kinase